MRKTDAPILFHNNKIRLAVLTTAFVLSLSACVTEKPNPDLVLAREAFAAATEVESAKFAPSYYHKAEETYREAMSFYKDQKYKEAVKEFRLARAYAEKAENAARIGRQKAGEEGL